MSSPEPEKKPGNLYIAMISLHGLVTGENIELGRDADTGGQIKYVIDLAKSLSSIPDVGRVDIFTRQIFDRRINAKYAEPIEQLTERAFIVRLPCGPRRYLRKEKLWPHIELFADNMLYHFNHSGRVPDVIHGHYADAGLIASRLAAMQSAEKNIGDHLEEVFADYHRQRQMTITEELLDIVSGSEAMKEDARRA